LSSLSKINQLALNRETWVKNDLGVIDLGNFSRIATFCFILGGIVAYLKVGAGLFDQVKSSGLRLQMGAIDKALQMEKTERRRYPRDIAAFLRGQFGLEEGRDPAKDPWGNYYQFQTLLVGTLPVGYELSSSGEDEILGTADDVIWRRENDLAGLVEQRSAKIVSPVLAGAKDQEQVDPLMARIEEAWKNLGKRPPESLVMDEAAMNNFLNTFLKQTYP